MICGRATLKDGTTSDGLDERTTELTDSDDLHPDPLDPVGHVFAVASGQNDERLAWIADFEHQSTHEVLLL